MNELKFKMSIMLKKINNNTICFEDIDFSYIDRFESSINFASTMFIDEKSLWTNFRKSIEENSFNYFNTILYKRNLEKTFSYLESYLKQALKNDDEYYMLIITMKAILTCLNMIIENYQVINALIN